jgi:hypothetical protein
MHFGASGGGVGPGVPGPGVSSARAIGADKIANTAIPIATVAIHEAPPITALCGESLDYPARCPENSGYFHSQAMPSSSRSCDGQ